MSKPVIFLRALEPEDIDLLFKWENDESVWKVSNTLVPFSKHILRKYLENAHLDIFEAKQLRLVIDVAEKEAKPRSIGAVDLFEFDPFHNRAGIGILIGETGERKKGYASAALEKMIEYAFDTLHLHQLFCNIREDNDASLKLFESKGFIKTGEKKDWLKTKEGYKNVFFMQVINKKDIIF
ncbi:MAG: GNAT family N-acetyltransferase [Bacteroidales bacterium]|nr:GNAT family N-acetyltransferase [Bacteroidales bacterium]